MTLERLAQWRDISLILLALEAFVLCLVPLVLLYYSNKGVHWLIARAREAFAWLRMRVFAAQRYVDRTTDKIVWPFLAWQGFTAGVVSGWSAICGCSKLRQRDDAADESR